MAGVSVYSLHKSSTRTHIARKADRQWGVKAEVVAQLRFDIPQMYRFHKRESVDVEVDLWRFQSIPAAAAAAAAAPPKRRINNK
jgi:predicted RNA methylase